MTLLIGVAIALGTVILCVLTHYETLRLTSLALPHLAIPPRPKVLFVIAAVSIAHLIEVGLFSLAFWGMQHFPSLGEIGGAFTGSVVDYFYFSVTSFTTLGIGDLFPHGMYRIVVGCEALTGFGLIGWSVSFTYLEMQQLWDAHPRSRGQRRLD